MPEYLPNNTLAEKIANTAVFIHGALQKHDELAMLVGWAIANGIRSVLEIGCDAGGTLYAWSQIPTVTRVVGITLQGGPYSSGRPLNPHGAAIIIGDSHSGKTRHATEHAAPYRGYDMIFIDGDHTYEGVRQDYTDYSGLRSRHGAIVLQDICDHGPTKPDVQVHRLWEEIRDERSLEFIRESDKTWGGIGVIQT